MFLNVATQQKLMQLRPGRLLLWCILVMHHVSLSIRSTLPVLGLNIQCTFIEDETPMLPRNNKLVSVVLRTRHRRSCSRHEHRGAGDVLDRRHLRHHPGPQRESEGRCSGVWCSHQDEPGERRLTGVLSDEDEGTPIVLRNSIESHRSSRWGKSRKFLTAF